VTQVASPEVVYQLDRMLVQVMDHGTGRSARALLPANLVVAGKSGTSSEFRDSWFAGFSGSHLRWCGGYDDNEPTDLLAPPERCRCGRISWGTGTNSWAAPMPDNLAEVDLEYPTDFASCRLFGRHRGGRRAGGAALPAKPGCRIPDDANPLATILDHAQQWLRGLVH